MGRGLVGAIASPNPLTCQALRLGTAGSFSLRVELGAFAMFLFFGVSYGFQGYG